MVKRFLESGLIKIPVLGSGDMFSSKDVNRFLKFTKAHGVIIARGAIHNPAIFNYKDHMLDTTEGSPTDLEEWRDNFNE
jgi:tRNA-dihydrouridine synthase